MAATILFLFVHEIDLSITDKEYEDFMLKVVNDKPSINEIKKWLEEHSNDL
jgi:prophage maintenance system killer protein